MKQFLPLAFVLVPVAAFAFAGSGASASGPDVGSFQDPRERIALLEREVAELKTEVANLKQGGGDSELAKQITAQKADLQKLLEWARSQGQAATTLQTALEEARTKGFTAGINPDSREVLLTGFEQLAGALKVDPLPPPADAKKTDTARSGATR